MNDEANPSFDALLEHAPFLRRLARGLVRDEARADDLVQATWTAALRRPPRDPAGARGWLAAVARRLSQDERKAESRRAAREAATARDEAQPAEPGLDERVELARAVLDAVQALDEPYRGVIWLRYYEDLGPRAIARRLEVPLETVSTRLRRGKQQLRAKLDARYGARREWLAAMTGLAALREPALVALATSTPALFAGLIALPLIAGGVLLAGTRTPRVEEHAASAAPAESVREREPLAPATLPTTIARADRSSASSDLVAEPHTVATLLDSGTSVLEGSVRWDGLEPEGPVHLAVMRADAGRPEGFVLARGSCAAGERFELEVPAGGAMLLVAAAVGVPPISATINLPSNGRARLDLIETLVAPALSGRLVDERGEPVAGAQLTARRVGRTNEALLGAVLPPTGGRARTTDEAGQSDPPDLILGNLRLDIVGGAFHLQSEVVESAADGAFSFRGIGRGRHVLEMRRPPNMGTGNSPGTHLTHRSRSGPFLVDVPAAGVEFLMSEGRLIIDVRDEHGPLDGVSVNRGTYAELEALSDGSAPAGSEDGWNSLAPDGRLSIHFDPADDRALYFQRPGYTSALLRLSSAVPDAQGNVTVHLRRTSTNSTLRVLLDGAGTALPTEVMVTLWHTPPTPGDLRPKPGLLRRELPVSGAQVLVDDVPPGGYRLTLEPTDGAPFEKATTEVDVPASGGDITLKLTPAAQPAELAPPR